MFKRKPFFIVFEGVEGCGKTYQSKKLYKSLIKKKIPTILTREPGGTKEAEILRNLIVNERFKNFLPETELLLIYAARHEHISNLILPLLKIKKIVLFLTRLKMTNL